MDAKPSEIKCPPGVAMASAESQARLPTPQKVMAKHGRFRRWSARTKVLFAFIVSLGVFLIFLVCAHQDGDVQSIRYVGLPEDLAIIFVVTDASTGEPIEG